MMRGVTWHIPELAEWAAAGHSAAEIRDRLKRKGCLIFPQFESGLFPAMIADHGQTDKAGYTNAWLRDTVCVAFALWASGDKESAHKAARGLFKALGQTKQVMIDTLQRGSGGDDHQRPAIRFTADAKPISKWANAQNDSLGYVLWFIGLLAREGELRPTPPEQSLIDLLAAYLNAVSYWQDLDSGHWEEEIKCNASSIGTVVAGLNSARPVLSDKRACDELIQKGKVALRDILPYESRTPGDERPTDAALLFLVEPLGVLEGAAEAEVIQDITTHLQGGIGIKRYLGDSYWSPDYREHFAYSERAADFSTHMATRDKYFKQGLEAQWTLFDPMLAVYFAKRFKTTGDAQDRRTAHWYLVRSLAQIIEVGKDEKVWRMPEAFFLEEDRWEPNDQIGLLWSQANLLYALTTFEAVFGNEPVDVSTMKRYPKAFAVSGDNLAG